MLTFIKSGCSCFSTKVAKLLAFSNLGKSKKNDVDDQVVSDTEEQLNILSEKIRLEKSNFNTKNEASSVNAVLNWVNTVMEGIRCPRGISEIGKLFSVFNDLIGYGGGILLPLLWEKMEKLLNRLEMVSQEVQMVREYRIHELHVNTPPLIRKYFERPAAPGKKFLQGEIKPVIICNNGTSQLFVPGYNISLVSLIQHYSVNEKLRMLTHAPIDINCLICLYDSLNLPDEEFLEFLGINPFRRFYLSTSVSELLATVWQEPLRSKIKEILEKLPPYQNHLVPAPVPQVNKNQKKNHFKKGGWETAAPSTVSVDGETDAGIVNQYKRSRFS